MVADARVAVIGGGLGGLAAAVTLAARGRSVTLFEANDWIGGKAAEESGHGFRFDMGPTILTLPSVLRRVFEEAGRKLEDELELVRLDPEWRCFFDSGDVLDLVDDLDDMKRRIDDLAPGRGMGEAYGRFIDASRRLHDISERFYFWRSVGGLSDMFRARESFRLSTLRDLLALRMGRTMGGTIRSFLRDERVAQMVDHFAQYVGSAPDASPAVLCGIAHMQVGEGVWYPIGGTRAVPVALGRLAAELGVDVRTGSAVTRIHTRGERATAVELADGTVHEFDVFVSNADAVRTHRELIGGDVSSRFERRRRYEAACSGVVLYLGLDRAYEHLEHHNFVFSRDPHEEFETIYRKGEPAPDPTCYVCAPARTEPAVAPDGGEALYVLVHAPYLRPHHDWSKVFPEYREVILDKLARTAGMHDIRERIAYESVLTPQDIHDRYRVLDGAIYGLASHGRFLGAFKPGNRSQDLENLYLSGGAAHPGPGMPMVLMSGWIAADCADSDLRGARPANVAVEQSA